METLELTVVRLPDGDEVKREVSKNIYRYFHDSVVKVVTFCRKYDALQTKKFVIWILKSYRGDYEDVPIGEFMTDTILIPNEYGLNAKIIKKKYSTYFLFDEKFNSYCCGIRMQDYIAAYHRNLGHVDVNKPWMRYKRMLCNTIMDAFIIQKIDSRDKIIDFKTRPIVIISNDLLNRIANPNSEKDRHNKYLQFVSPGIGNNYLPWKYYCTFLYDMANANNIVSRGRNNRILTEESKINIYLTTLITFLRIYIILYYIIIEITRLLDQSYDSMIDSMMDQTAVIQSSTIYLLNFNYFLISYI